MKSVIHLFFVFLTGCVANFATDGSVDQTEVRQTVEKLFNALSSDKYKETQHYANILQSEKLKQEKAFSEWEEEARHARSNDRLNRKNVSPSVRGNIFKRDETKTLSSKPTQNASRLSHAYLSAVEDQYIEHFGNDPRNVKRWEAAKNWYLEDGEPMLKKFCAEAHVRAGKEAYPVERVFLESKLLEFKNEEYFRRLVDVVQYTVKLPTINEDPLDFFLLPQTDGPFYIVEGTRPDCVYYLMNADHASKLVLRDHVCGITIDSEREKVNQ